MDIGRKRKTERSRESKQRQREETREGSDPGVVDRTCTRDRRKPSDVR